MSIAKQSGHRLLILGSMDEFVDLVRQAKQRGIYTVVCDGYEDGPAKSVADKAYLEDIRNTSAIAEICRDENIDGIVASFSDILAECMIDIADEAGLPAYLKPDQEKYLREKTLMKRMFEELGIKTARHREVSRSSLEDDMDGLSFPVVVKPVNGYGSHGVFVASGIDEVRSRFEAAASQSSFDTLIVEEYFEGPEFNIMTWVAGGEAHVLSVADRQKALFEVGELPQVVRIVYPSSYTNEVLSEATDIATKIAKYVGLQDGPLCIQAFYDGAGGLVVCEAAGRIFGYEHELLALTSCLTVEELLLDCAYDIESARRKVAAHSPYLSGCAAGLYFHGKDGVVADTSKLDSLEKVDGVVEYHPYYHEGDRVSHGRGSKPYAARFYVKGCSREEVDEASRLIFSEASLAGESGAELLKNVAFEEL